MMTFEYISFLAVNPVDATPFIICTPSDKLMPVSAGCVGMKATMFLDDTTSCCVREECSTGTEVIGLSNDIFLV